MSDPFILHGDAEALVRHILVNLTPELADYGVTVSTTWHGYSDGSRWITVTQEGSSKAQWNVINKPRIDVDVRAELPTSTAKDIAEIAEASIFRAVGTAAYGAKLVQVREEQGITRIPDVRDEQSTRYLFSLRLVCMQHPD